jgi:NlpC/P60 family putative phage cell wall peptidase
MNKIITRAQVVAEARTWLGTQYRHQGRLKGVGVDCVGLVLGVAVALGVDGRDFTGYSRRPDGQLAPLLNEQTLPVRPGEEDAGDVVVFHWNNDPMHIGILTSKDSVIHAFAINRKVCEHALDAKWRLQISAFRRIPGVV